MKIDKYAWVNLFFLVNVSSDRCTVRCATLRRGEEFQVHEERKSTHAHISSRWLFREIASDRERKRTEQRISHKTNANKLPNWHITHSFVRSHIPNEFSSTRFRFWSKCKTEYTINLFHSDVIKFKYTIYDRVCSHFFFILPIRMCVQASYASCTQNSWYRSLSCCCWSKCHEPYF